MGKVSAPISQINSYTDGNNRPIYLVDKRADRCNAKRNYKRIDYFDAMPDLLATVKR